MKIVSEINREISENDAKMSMYGEGLPLPNGCVIKYEVSDSLNLLELLDTKERSDERAINAGRAAPVFVSWSVPHSLRRRISMLLFVIR